MRPGAFGEEAFYERLQPFAASLLALFDRDQLPARSTLSRFLVALTREPVEDLRSLFLNDLLALSPKGSREANNGLPLFHACASIVPHFSRQPHPL